MMTIVTAKSLPLVGKLGRQTGVALLQVLLISAVISLLAIRFTETARDQVLMASYLDHRAQTQLLAYSVLNEVVFLEMSEKITPMSQPDGDLDTHLPIEQKLNRFGKPVRWREGATVEVQDLNGLLPHMFPYHVLWERLLSQASIEQADIKEYLGTWRDFQDLDLRSWDLSGDEPLALPTGQPYINGPPQNNKIAKLIFADRPELLSLILDVSDVNAGFETSLYNAPQLLLDSLFEPDVANLIKEIREGSRNQTSDIDALLPLDYDDGNIFTHNSNRLRINIHIPLQSGSWSESKTIYIQAGSIPPFVTVVNN